MIESLQIEQALHGYDRGHRLLAGSLVIDPEDDRAMLAMSDLSGSRVVEGFLEYLTAYMLPSNSYFVVAKTWYATEMRRPGCVWTHSLLLPRRGLEAIRNAEVLLSLFVRPSLNLNFRYSDNLALPPETFRTADPELELIGQDRLICMLEDLYGTDKGNVSVAVSSGSEMERFLLRMWSQLWPDLRARFSFCSGSLSRRTLNGHVLDVQCGPARIVREIGTVPSVPCQEQVWAKTIWEDLLHPGRFRDFLKENGYGLTRRTAVSALAKTYLSSISGDVIETLRTLAQAFPLRLEAVELKRRTLRNLTQIEAQSEVISIIVLLSHESFASLPADIVDALSRVTHQNPRSVALAFTSVSEAVSVEFANLLLEALAASFSRNDFEWLSENIPDLFNALLLKCPEIAYQDSFWDWNLSVLEKVEIFRLLLRSPATNRQLLFDSLFSCADSELLSRLVGDLSSQQLPQILGWIQSHERAVTSPEWTAFLRNHAPEFIAWLNTLPHPSLQTVVLAANVLDAPPPLNTVLSETSIERLALAVHKLPYERHEVAAFLFITTAWVRRSIVATIFIDSFASLHKAIAQSRLSNRAWHLIESILAPLPTAEWDSCEKLRRATLHFMKKNAWDFRILARHLIEDIELFYDFTRTAKSYNEGYEFLTQVYEAAQKGELALNKKQAKELRKLLGKGFWS